MSNPTMKELKEFIELKNKIFTDGIMFVVFDPNDPDSKRYDELARKCIPFLRKLG